jgi:hypothetical protein
MSKRRTTDLAEIYQLLLDDPAMTEAVARDDKGVYLLGANGKKRYITMLEVEQDATKEIVKLQRPIAGNAGKNEVLIYNESRTAEAILTMKNKMIKEIFGDEVKVYWWAWVPEKEGMIQLIEAAPEQDW